jgi:hypothetical protein
VNPPPPPNDHRARLLRNVGPRLRRALFACEEACRGSASSSMAFLQQHGKVSREVDACSNLVMDCSYIASATARLLSRFDRQDVDVVVFQLEVCRRAATDAADACARPSHAPAALEACARHCRACARACADLLALFRAQPVIVVEETAGAEQVGCADGLIPGAMS